MIEKAVSHTVMHAGAHIGFFSGIGMLLPLLSQAWTLHLKPWLYSPFGFYIAMALIGGSLLMIAFAAGSVSKICKNVGWMIVIPGILALLFSSFGELNVYSWADQHITGFATIQPGFEWFVGHSVPQTAIIGGFYILFGVCLVWLSHRISRVAEHI